MEECGGFLLADSTESLNPGPRVPEIAPSGMARARTPAAKEGRRMPRTHVQHARHVTASPAVDAEFADRARPTNEFPQGKASFLRTTFPVSWRRREKIFVAR